MDKPPMGHGGARPGAGRRQKAKEPLSERVMIRMTPSMVEFIDSHGGADLIRGLIEEKMNDD